MTEWTDPEKRLVIEKVEAGWSATRIAAQTPGRSRNSVIGWCSRNNITLHGDNILRTRTRRPRVKLARKSCEKPSVSPEEVKEVSLAPKPDEGSIRGVPDRFQCKYPVSGEGVEIIFCHNRRTDKSYCEPHQEICYTASRY